MFLKTLLSVAMLCVVLALSHAALAQQRDPGGSSLPQSRPAAGAPSAYQLKPKGEVKFEACCTSCQAGGCTGCNAYPNTPHLNCGTGLIKANCQVVNDTTTCVRDDD